MQRIVIYSKQGCPFCSLLKLELGKRGFSYEEVDLSDDANRQEFYDRAGVNTVPQLYLADPDHTEDNLTGRRIGGWSDIKDRWELLE